MPGSVLQAFREMEERARIQLDSASTSFEALVAWAEDRISQLQVEVRDLRAKNFQSGLNQPAFRDAICAHAADSRNSWAPSPIAVHGDGPWGAKDFREFLQDRGFELVASEHSATDVVILGDQGWDEERLLELVTRNMQQLEIYTQELFVVGLVAGRDPILVMTTNGIEQIASEHAAIRLLTQRGIRWPVDGRSRFSSSLESRRPTGGNPLLAPLTPSVQLAEIVGDLPISRPDLMAHLWSYIREHDLQDPENRRIVRADKKLKAVFGKDTILMSELPALVAKHVR